VQPEACDPGIAIADLEPEDGAEVRLDRFEFTGDEGDLAHPQHRYASAAACAPLRWTISAM
jgi:hypothetical protein